MLSTLSASSARALGLSAVLLVSACAVPDLGPLPVPRGPESIAAARSLPSALGAEWPAQHWWRGYGDPQLTVLIEEALRGSPDIAAADARLRRARGATQETGAPLYPTMDVEGQATLDRQSLNNGFPRQFVPRGWNDRGQLAAALDFDLDVWRRHRAALAGATSEARAAEVDAQQVRLVLAAAIAAAYSELSAQFALRDVRQRALEVRLASRGLIAERLAAGLENRGNLRQADGEVAGARAQLTGADEAIGLRRNQIAALVGAGPDRGLAIIRPTLAAGPLRSLPENVTTDLVGRRPDLIAARERAEAAASRIKAARAEFFPAIRLSALVGMQSLGLGQLVESGSTFGSIGPAISLPIFRGGALQGRYRAARARFDEAVADYDRTVLDAYRQVADAVTGARSQERRVGDAREALTAAEDAYAISQGRYRAGLSNFLQVLTVEDRVLQARLNLAEAEAASRANDVALVRALGGGFRPADIAASKDDPNG